MAQLKTLLKALRDSWKETRKILEALSESDFAANLPGTTRLEFIRAVSSMLSVANKAAKSSGALGSRRDALRKFLSAEFSRQITNMTVQCEAIRQGRYEKLPQFRTHFFNASAALVQVQWMVEGASEGVSAQLSQDQADVLAHHDALQAATTELAPKVEELREKLGSAVDRFDAAVETADSRTAEHREWLAKQRTVLTEVAEDTTNRAATFVTASEEAFTKITQHLSDAEADTAAARAAREEAEVHEAALAKASETAESAQDRVNEYEAKLRALTEQVETTLQEDRARFQALHDQIEDLLAGATNVRLASSFEDKAESYEVRKRIYSAGFIAVLGILAVMQIKYTPPTGDWYVGFLGRVAYGFAFGWLAIWLGRRYREVSRLSEDYSFKAVRAKTYEGYKERAAQDDPSGDLQLDLLRTTLNLISDHPLDVMDRSPGDRSSGNPAAGVISRMTGRKGKQRERPAPGRPSVDDDA